MSTSLKDATSIVSDLSATPFGVARTAKLLPAEPVTKIRPARFWETIDLRELWAHREVLYFLIWRDLKVRYKQTMIGAAWVVFQPILMTLVFAVFLGRFIRVPSDGIPYPVFAYAAMLLSTFISSAILSSSYSLVTNSHIITRIYFSRLALPAAAVGVRLVDFMIASLFLFVFMIYYRVQVGWAIVALPLFVAEIAVLALSIGVLTAALYVRYRDVGTLLPILLQVWMFVSPTVYSASVVPPRFRLLYSMNPLVGIMGGFRSALFNLSFDWTSIIISAFVTLVLLAFSLQVFHTLDSSFADEV